MAAKRASRASVTVLHAAQASQAQFQRQQQQHQQQEAKAQQQNTHISSNSGSGSGNDDGNSQADALKAKVLVAYRRPLCALSYTSGISYHFLPLRTHAHMHLRTHTRTRAHTHLHTHITPCLHTPHHTPPTRLPTKVTELVESAVNDERRRNNETVAKVVFEAEKRASQVWRTRQSSVLLYGRQTMKIGTFA